MGNLPRKRLIFISSTAENNKTKFNNQLLSMLAVWTLIGANTSSFWLEEGDTQTGESGFDIER